MLRRYRAAGATKASGELRLGELVLSRTWRQVLRDGHPVPLTKTELRLLEVLAVNAGRVVPTKRLVEWVWGYDDVPPAGAALLKSHLSHLRRKLGLPGKGRGGIRNVAGVGYQLSLSG